MIRTEPRECIPYRQVARVLALVCSRLTTTHGGFRSRTWRRYYTSIRCGLLRDGRTQVDPRRSSHAAGALSRLAAVFTGAFQAVLVAQTGGQLLQAPGYQTGGHAEAAVE